MQKCRLLMLLSSCLDHADARNEHRRRYVLLQPTEIDFPGLVGLPMRYFCRSAHGDQQGSSSASLVPGCLTLNATVTPLRLKEAVSTSSHCPLTTPTHKEIIANACSKPLCYMRVGILLLMLVVTLTIVESA
jgi:hypothetical protein